MGTLAENHPRPCSKPVTGTERPCCGAGVIWNELAAFYAELANTTADPFFEELADELSDAVAAEADPWRLRSCLSACAEGGPAINAFCAGIPDPRLRAACRALYFVGEVACSGWCYSQYGW